MAHTMTMKMPTLLKMPVSDGTVFHAMMAMIEAMMVAGPASLEENFGNSSPQTTIKEAPMARDNAFCIAPRMVPICVANR